MLDVVVVGAGPAGLATAIAARLEGLSAVVLEPRHPPLDKACGEGLMPTALAALGALGVDLDEHGAPIRGVRYVSDETVADAEFPGGGVGRGVRRIDLHERLLERARALGVELRFGERAVGLVPRGVATERGELLARFVVGADGLLSAVRFWGGFAGRAASRQRFGIRRHLAIAPVAERVEVVFGELAEAYLTPLGAAATGVALLWEGETRGFDDLLATRFPEWLRERLAGAPVLSRDRGAGPFRQRTRGVARGALALVGDAGGYVDALTGEGTAIAFQEALALARAMRTGDLAAYERASTRIRRAPERVTRLALFMARRPRLRRRVVEEFDDDPNLFARVLGVLACGRSFASIGIGSMARLVTRIVLSS